MNKRKYSLGNPNYHLHSLLLLLLITSQINPNLRKKKSTVIKNKENKVREKDNKSSKKREKMEKN